MVQTRKRLKTAVFESVLFNSDILVAIGPYLAAEEFVNLASTSRHFGGRTPTGPHTNNNNMHQNLSLMEKIACQVINKEQTLQERAALPTYQGEGWIALYHQLLLLRKPLIFDHLIGRFAQYVDGDKSRVMLSAYPYTAKSAVSSHIMRAGKHYVEVLTRSDMGLVGVMRPVANCFANHPQILLSYNFLTPTYLDGFLSPKFLGERNERWGDSNVNGCQYSLTTGLCCWSNWEERGQSDNAAARETWDGQESFSRQTQNLVLGLLLDLEEGTLSVYKNGRRLGTMKSGLSGEYCWVVSIQTGDEEFSIRRANVPEDA